MLSFNKLLLCTIGQGLFGYFHQEEVISEGSASSAVIMLLRYESWLLHILIVSDCSFCFE